MRFRAEVFRNFRLGLWIAVLLGSFASPPFLIAQTTSTIQGTVTDKQGLAVSGAEVRAEGSTVAASRTVVTDANGAYQIPGLPAGDYKLTVSHSGFATRIFERVELTLNRTLALDIKLDVGTVQERVEVSSEIPLLDTTSSSSGATVLPQQIENMPINGRNYLD